MGLVISQKTREKLRKKHCVTEEEIKQCFASRDGRFLIDTREEHRTDPPTHWFLAETYYGRLLKVVFVPDVDGEDLHIKTAYEPNEIEMHIYRKYGLGISE